MVVHVASTGNLQLPLQVSNIFFHGNKLFNGSFVLVECFSFLPRPMRTHGSILSLVADGNSYSMGHRIIGMGYSY